VRSVVTAVFSDAYSDDAMPPSLTEAENGWRPRVARPLLTGDGGLCARLLAMLSVRSKFLTSIALMLLVAASSNPAAAQVLIPHGDFGSDFEKYLVATISFVLLCLAAWQFYRNRR